MSRRQARESIGAGRTEGEGQLAEYVAEVIAACRVRTARESIVTEVKQKFSAAFREMTRLGLKFQEVTGEYIISRDLDVLIVEPGNEFDAASMSDEWEDPKESSRDMSKARRLVLCTTQLGLQRVVKVEERHGKERRAVIAMLLKPTVVLMSALRELCNEKLDARSHRCVDSATLSDGGEG